MDRKQLIEAVHSRGGNYGVMTADRYFRAIEQCSGGNCPSSLFNAKDAEVWAKRLEEAEGKLTYADKDMVVLKSTTEAVAEAVKEKEMSAKAIMTFDAVVTTTRKDRDGDILQTKGATVDDKSPLLWQHMPIQPIGALVKTLDHTDDMLTARFAIADTELGRDAATLVDMGALRISHGFNPTDYAPLEDESGFEFKEFEIFEVSLVSVPSNKDAVITAFSREKLFHPAVKAWAEKAFNDRVTQVATTFLKDAEISATTSGSSLIETDTAATCNCQKNAEPEIKEVFTPSLADEWCKTASDEEVDSVFKAISDEISDRQRAKENEEWKQLNAVLFGAT